VLPVVAQDGTRQIGRIEAFVGAAPEIVTVDYGPVQGLLRGVERTWDVSTMSLKIFGRMLIGEASLKNLSGPLTIADYAGKSAGLGLTAYLLFLAMISVSLGVLNLLPLLKGETQPQSRDFFWCSGSDEGWWAVRSGDWKLVGEKDKLGLFDLSKDVSEANDLAKQMPEKVAELTKLHDAWLADMAKPVKAGEKRYNMAAPAAKKPKKMTKEEKKKARDMERAKKREPAAPPAPPEAPKP
jgi:hypothetical protein